MPVRSHAPRSVAPADGQPGPADHEAPPLAGDGSAELLRRTLPLMSRHAAGYAPDSYALWYEYVRGGNSALRADLESVLGEHARLSHELTFDLHRRHVADRTEETAREAGAGLLELMHVFDEALDAAGAQASGFDARLAAFGEALESADSPAAMRRHVEAMREDVGRMSGSLASLDARLEAARGETARLRDELVRAREEASFDPLTGVLNRRGFDAAIRRFCADATPDAPPFSVVMIDIDHFRRINDTYGHPFGDQVLRAIGQVLSQLTQRRDLAARYGGEEFALLLPETRLGGARDVAERLRVAISRGYISRGAARTPVGSITVSAGVAQHAHGETAVQVLARAERALLASKRSGRDRVGVGR
jgi:diguanylate cyclase